MTDRAPSRRHLLEVCVETLAGLDAACRGGADRVELCSALGIGGLTPAESLIRAAAAAPLPVHLLCRPREGDFIYSAAERALVAADIRLAAEAGLAGVVMGASGPDRRLDETTLAAWIAHARDVGAARSRPLSLTLHRAFDLVPDLGGALEQAITLGFDRVLTSGGAPRAVDGMPALAMLQAQAAGRIGILAGSGVDIGTLPAILSTGIVEVHASCRSVQPIPPDDPERRFGFVGADRVRTDPTKVAGLTNALRRAKIDDTNI